MNDASNLLFSFVNKTINFPPYKLTLHLDGLERVSISIEHVNVTTSVSSSPPSIAYPITSRVL